MQVLLNRAQRKQVSGLWGQGKSASYIAKVLGISWWVVVAEVHSYGDWGLYGRKHWLRPTNLTIALLSLFALIFVSLSLVDEENGVMVAVVGLVILMAATASGSWALKKVNQLKKQL
ncbi:MAG TPA: hypothetical protein VEA59_06470 [Patescibacteria group bacterium]|nr:hypothetical protein [Patescibacteria group bacterium]